MKAGVSATARGSVKGGGRENAGGREKDGGREEGGRWVAALGAGYLVQAIWRSSRVAEGWQHIDSNGAAPDETRYGQAILCHTRATGDKAGYCAMASPKAYVILLPLACEHYCVQGGNFVEKEMHRMLSSRSSFGKLVALDRYPSCYT